MKFGHYWPKDPAAERIEYLREFSSPYDVLYQAMPILTFEQFSVGGDDGRAQDTPEARARALQRVRDTAMGGVCGTVRHLP